MTTPTLREALEAAKSWIERWTSHVGNCRGGNECTCGRTAILAECAAGLSSPAPDRLREEEQRTIAFARSLNGGHKVTHSLLAIIDRLSRQPEAEPDAYAEIIGGRVVSCRPDKSPHCTAPLYLTSLRLDRERLARTLYRRLVLNPPADFDDASADLQNEWLQLADAIMRETW